MSASSVGYDRIWAWREGMGDVYAGEWAPEGDKDAPMEAEAYILATPAALAASPEGKAMIREAEARGMERLVQSLIGIRRASAHRMSGTRGDDHSYYFHTANAAIAAAEDALTKIARLGQEWDAEAAAIRAAKGETE